MATSRNILGLQIKLLREKQGLSQQALSEKMGVDRQYIWKMENGRINISADYIDKVIKNLECKHSDFFNTKGYNKFKSSNN